VRSEGEQSGRGVTCAVAWRARRQGEDWREITGDLSQLTTWPTFAREAGMYQVSSFEIVSTKTDLPAGRPRF
jgi:hypothetical protein